MALFEISKNNPTKIVNIGKNRTLRTVTSGRQSNFYILTIGEEEYAIKTHVSSDNFGSEPDAHQPYINEMLQTQSIAIDLSSQLDSLKVKMSTFLFASGQVSCTRYEQNEGNYSKEFDISRLADLFTTVANYILMKRYNEDPLWHGVDLDLPMERGRLMLTFLRNFRTKADGTLVWIDPFIYSR